MGEHEIQLHLPNKMKLPRAFSVMSTIGISVWDLNSILSLFFWTNINFAMKYHPDNNNLYRIIVKNVTQPSQNTA